MVSSKTMKLAGTQFESTIYILFPRKLSEKLVNQFQAFIILKDIVQ